MPKRCYRCKQVLNDDAFGVRKTHGGHPCKKCASLYTRERNARYRLKLFTILGGAKCCNPECAVPGGMKDIRALQFEHINSDGGDDKRRFNRHYQTMIVYYTKHPDEARKQLQIFCSNCNWIKRSENNEVCTNHRYRE